MLKEQNEKNWWKDWAASVEVRENTDHDITDNKIQLIPEEVLSGSVEHFTGFSATFTLWGIC